MYMPLRCVPTGNTSQVCTYGVYLSGCAIPRVNLSGCAIPRVNLSGVYLWVYISQVCTSGYTSLRWVNPGYTSPPAHGGNPSSLLNVCYSSSLLNVCYSSSLLPMVGYSLLSSVGEGEHGAHTAQC